MVGGQLLWKGQGCVAVRWVDIRCGGGGGGGGCCAGREVGIVLCV